MRLGNRELERLQAWKLGNGHSLAHDSSLRQKAPHPDVGTAVTIRAAEVGIGEVSIGIG